MTTKILFSATGWQTWEAPLRAALDDTGLAARGIRMLGAVAVEHVRFVLVAEPPGALQHRVVVDRHPVEAPQLEVEHAREGELAVGEELEVAGAGDEGAALGGRPLAGRVAEDEHSGRLAAACDVAGSTGRPPSPISHCTPKRRRHLKN